MSASLCIFEYVSEMTKTKLFMTTWPKFCANLTTLSDGGVKHF